MTQLNEVAQWSVILFLVITVLGIARQLGFAMLPKSGRLADEMGPDIGARVPQFLLTPADWGQAEGIAVRGRGRLAFVAVDEDCRACDAWIEAFEAERRDTGTNWPLVIISGKSSIDHRDRLTAIAALLVDDPGAERLFEAGIRGFPFLMLTDDEWRVEHKQLGGDPLLVLRDEFNQKLGPTTTETNGRLEAVQAGRTGVK